MKLCIIDTLGLCYDGNTLTKRGLGGSESAVILMAKELAKIGFDVTVFNDCEKDDASPGHYENVLYRPLREIESSEEHYDVAIGSRSVVSFAPDAWRDQFKTFTGGMPKFEAFMSRVRYKILWMHDTFCDGDDYIEEFIINGKIDEIFTLSDFHTSYVTNAEHGRKRMFEVLKKHVFMTRNGVCAKTDKWIDVKQKDPNLFVYNSSVTKGMYPLVEDVWPKIKHRLPNAKLTVIGGYYRMRSGLDPDENEMKWRSLANDPTNLLNDIDFTGIIKQSEISEILRSASFMIYPAEFPETFGISTLESLAHNTPLITCDFGALEETAIDDACYKIPYPIQPNPLFPHIDKEWQVNSIVDAAVNAYNDPYLHQQKMYACNKVKNICNWDSVALQWKQHLFKKLGRFLPVAEYRKVNKINHDVRKVFGRAFFNQEELQEPRNSIQLKINIVTPVYNSEEYIKNCIMSVAQQDYDNYKMFIIDDCSSDNTKGVAADTIAALPRDIRTRFEILSNYNNFGAVYNQYTTIKQHCQGDIIMLLDGDDCLVNDPNIFHKYNNIYHDGAEFTYGSCWSVADNIPLIAQEYPPEVKQNKSYRSCKFNWNMPYTHLRTFHPSLMNSLSESDFRDENGEWFRAGGDAAMFYNLIEQASPSNIVCVPEVVYLYNDLNPLNDYKVNGNEQNKNAESIMKKIDPPKKKILIAIPTAKYIETETFKSIYDLEVPHGHELDFQYFYGYRIDQIRNLIADWVVKGYDYLFSVDSDIVFPPDTLKKLVSHDKDLVSGVYRQRNPEQHLEVYNLDQSRMDISELNDYPLTRIGGCGFGCVLVKKEVFEKIGYPQFEYHVSLDHSGTVSEDTDFCMKAMKAGFKLWCDPTVVCGHIGSSIMFVEPPKDKNVQQRLRELHDQPLLPMQHVEYLWSMKQGLGVEPKVIYDIGACVLHWTNRAKEVWPNAMIVPIEAMSEVGELYEEKGIERWVGNCLLSDKQEEVDFYENLEHPGGNSLFKENNELSPLADKLFPEDKKVKRTTDTLDNVVSIMNLPKPDMIKMDIQGSELAALKGASQTLKSVDHLILELQDKDYNFGAPKAQEVIDYLKSIGFEMVGEGMFCGSSLGVDGDYHFRRSTLKK